MHNSEILKNLDKINKYCDSSNNKNRNALFENCKDSVRGDIQWHGIPKKSANETDYMPVTAECLNELWIDKFHFTLDEFYNDPEIYLSVLLKMKIAKYELFCDDTPIDRNIPLSFATVFEACTLGADAQYHENNEPSLISSSIIDETTELPLKFNFTDNVMVEKAKAIYEKIQSIVGDEFKVVFPPWFRGPQGVALYLRGYDKFMIDMHINPDFSHRILAYVTKAAKEYTIWRANFLNEGIEKGDLFNDDIPLISPSDYDTFFLPYENELCDFFKGIYYWHSCGDISKHIPNINQIHSMELLDIGVSVDDKHKALNSIHKDQCIEIRFLASKYIQNMKPEETENYMRNVIAQCKESRIKKYVLRTSGMGIINNAEEDLLRLKSWVEITKKIQNELA